MLENSTCPKMKEILEKVVFFPRSEIVSLYLEVHHRWSDEIGRLLVFYAQVNVALPLKI